MSYWYHVWAQVGNPGKARKTSYFEEMQPINPTASHSPSRQSYATKTHDRTKFSFYFSESRETQKHLWVTRSAPTLSRWLSICLELQAEILFYKLKSSRLRNSHVLSMISSAAFMYQLGTYTQAAQSDCVCGGVCVLRLSRKCCMRKMQI